MKCPHCLKEISIKYLRAFSEKYYYGDGDGEDNRDSSNYGHNNHYDPHIREECPHCMSDFFVRMYIPEYVQGEPRDEFDWRTFFGARGEEYQAEVNAKRTFESEYFWDSELADITDHVLRSKTIKEAYKGQKRKYRKLIKWIFELKSIESEHIGEYDE